MALTEALMLSSSAVPAAKFSEVYAELLQVNPGKRKRNLDAAFEVGMLIYWLFTIAFCMQYTKKSWFNLSVVPLLSI